jgi:hypothetical protein
MGPKVRLEKVSPILKYRYRKRTFAPVQGSHWPHAATRARSRVPGSAALADGHLNLRFPDAPTIQRALHALKVNDACAEEGTLQPGSPPLAAAFRAQTLPGQGLLEALP